MLCWAEPRTARASTASISPANDEVLYVSITTLDRTDGRTYEGTHPWINFRVDLRNLGPECWMLLGESRSKIEHIAGSLLNPDMAYLMHEVYLAKGVLATTAIEGNTLSEEEALRLVQGKLELPPSREYLAREIENIIGAFNTIRDELIGGGEAALTPTKIAEYNEMILDGLDLEDGVVPGEIRKHRVGVARYLGAPPEDCGYLLQELCDWLNGPDFRPDSPQWAMPFAILKAIVAHLYLAWIHPFGDGNGRTARLIELQILMGAGVPTPAVHLLSNHYNQTRSQYYRELDRASRSPDGELPFIRYAIRGFVDGLKAQLAHIRSQQFADRWEQYIYQRFAHRDSPAALRQRRLVLELSKVFEPVPKTAMRRLSTVLTEAYVGKTGKTLTRDLNALEEMGLVRKTAVGYEPRRDAILAFLPLSADPA